MTISFGIVVTTSIRKREYDFFQLEKQPVL